MRKKSYLPLLLILTLSACGQPGPLYLPKNAPKVYDEPAASEPNEVKEEKETKPAPPPIPKKPEPKTEQ